MNKNLESELTTAEYRQLSKARRDLEHFEEVLEAKVLQRQGLSNLQIARILGITESSVRTKLKPKGK